MVSRSLRRWVGEEYPDLLRIWRLVRHEASTAWTSAAGAISPAQRRRVRQLRSERGLKLHVASGATRVDGWVHVDAAPTADVRIDLRGRLPFADGSAALVFTEHFLDHLEYPSSALGFLRECMRVLGSGGRIRIVVHDGEALARAYVQRDHEFLRRALPGVTSFAEATNLIYTFNGFHQFIYDYETLKGLLERAGFIDVHRSEYLRSAIPELNLDAPGADREVQSLYVEATRP